MEKLLSRGLFSKKNVAGKLSLSAKHVSTTLLLLLLCLLMPQKGWAAVYTYDFSEQSERTLTSSSTVDGLAVLDSYPNLAVSSVTQPESGQNHWYIHNASLYLAAGGNRNMAILNLRNGDKVTVTFVKNNDNGNTNYDAGNFVSTNAWYNDNGVRKAVTTTDIIESGKEYYMSADGNLKINFHRYIGIKSVSVERYENTPTISFSESSKTGELINLNFDEPTLSYSPNTATVIFSSSNQKVAKIGNQATGDLMFINTGITTITATMTINGTAYTASYSVTVKADPATYEVNGNTYTLTGAGKLLERRVTEIPCMSMEFGDASNTNTTLVRNINGTMVATVLDENGWQHFWANTVDGKLVPHQGTFYKFTPSAAGKLTVKGMLTADNTADLVDATNDYNVVGTIQYNSGNLQTSTFNLTANHTYYLYAHTYNTNQGGWAIYQLNSFSFEPVYKFETESVVLRNGETEYTQAVQGASGTVSYSVETKGNLSANIDGNGRVSGISGDGGAIIVSATDAATNLTLRYVITVPYKTNVWNFANPTGAALYSQFQINATKGASYAVAYEQVSQDKTTNNITRVDRPVIVANLAVNGTNAMYMDATAGLIINAAAKKFGSRTDEIADADKPTGWDSTDPEELDKALRQMLEYDITKVSNPKSLSIGSGTSITIPNLKQGQYIRVYWCSHSRGKSGCTYAVTNATDLDGKAITTTFTHSGWSNSATDANADVNPSGANIFKVAEDGDVTFTLQNSWGWIARIEVSDEYNTELRLMSGDWSNYNPVGFNDHDTSDTSDDEYDPASASITVVNGKPQTVVFRGWSGHNRTRAQNAKPAEITVTAEGNIDYTAVKGYDSFYENCTLTVEGGTGNLLVTQKVMFDGYCLDKKETWIAVGEVTKKDYPYTWDFTQTNMSQDLASTTWSNLSTATGDSYAEKYGSWTGSDAYGMTTYKKVDAADGNNYQVEKPLFAQGAELNTTSGTPASIAESAGLGVTVSGDYTDNGTLKLDGQNMAGVGKLTIPGVGENTFVYVMANAEPTVTVAAGEATAVNDAASGVYGWKITPTNGTTNVELSFAEGVEVMKVGVTDITKSVNKLGFATESRNHAIDHTLTGEFTANDVNAYIITSDNYNYEAYKGATISLGEPVDVIPANTGVVLYKAGTTEKTTAPLFYPAVNVANSSVEGNMMVANVVSGTVNPQNGDYTTFIMSMFKGTYNSTTQQSTTPTEQDYEGFYPIIEAGTLGANKAYLQILTSSIPKALWDGGNGQGQAGNAKVYILIDVDYNGEETAIQRVELEGVNEAEADKGVYYNLSGQKLIGKPSEKGVYIKNGKKVYVK